MFEGRAAPWLSLPAPMENTSTLLFLLSNGPLSFWLSALSTGTRFVVALLSCSPKFQHAEGDPLRALLDTQRRPDRRDVLPPSLRRDPRPATIDGVHHTATTGPSPQVVSADELEAIAAGLAPGIGFFDIFTLSISSPSQTEVYPSASSTL